MKAEDTDPSHHTEPPPSQQQQQQQQQRPHNRNPKRCKREAKMYADGMYMGDLDEEGRRNGQGTMTYNDGCVQF
jgi:hypothetical protein